MKKTINQMRIYRLMNLVRELDDKSGQLRSVIDCEGLSDKADYSNKYCDIGREFVNLHGTETDFLYDQIDKMILIIYDMIFEENPDALESMDELYHLFFSLNDKEYRKVQQELIKKISSDRIREFSYKFQDYDMNNLVDNDVEEPNFYNTDLSKWHINTENVVTYEFSKNRHSLHGILVHEDLHDFFEIKDDEMSQTDLNKCRIIRLFYRKKAHECYILGSDDGRSVYLYWVQADFRKKLIRRFPEYFSYTNYDKNMTNNKKIFIVFDRTYLNENRFYSIDFVEK
jgi:hypothetical protein